MQKNIMTIPFISENSTAMLNSLFISQIQWNSRNVPTTYVSMSCKEDGLHITFNVQEVDPLAKKHEHMSRVCEDSAVELFLAFNDTLTDKEFTPHMDEHIYMNIEINSNAAAYIKYGKHRKDRIALTLDEIELFQIKTKKTPQCWECKFIVPSCLIENIISYNPFVIDSVFAFNLYKICETKGREQFASFKKVESETPNFHVPESFALGIIK